MPEPVTSPNQVSPPSGGGLGSQTPAVSAAGVQPGASPAVPQTLEQMSLAALAAQAPPVVPPASAAPQPSAPVVAPAATPSVEELQAQIASLRAQVIPETDLQLMQRYARMGWEAELRAQMAQPANPAPSAPVLTAVQPHPVTGVIPFSEEDRSWLVADANAPGGVRAVEGAPPDIVQRYLQHKASTARFYQNFAIDPAKYIDSMIEERASKAAEARTLAIQQEQASREAGRQAHETIKDWAYVKGPDGQPVRDPMTGHYRKTPAGELYYGFADQLYAGGQGIKDVAQLHQMAQTMMLGHLYRQQAARQQPAPAAPAAPIAPVPAFPPAPPANPLQALQQPFQPAPPQNLQAFREEQQQLLLQRALQQSQGYGGFTQSANGATPGQVLPNGRPMSLLEMSRQVAQQQGVTL